MQLVKGMVLSVAAVALVAQPAFAHVTVKPGEVLSGEYQTFNVSAPNEREAATVAIEVLIPDSLTGVRPTVKPGWEISTEQTGTGEDAKITSITWQGGEIPEGQRDDFSFNAKTPDETGELQWKAYQTYEGGVVVAWDKTEAEQPKKEDGSPDFSKSGPLSITNVVAETGDSEAAGHSGGTDNGTLGLFVAIAALFVALGSFVFASKKNDTQKKH